MNEVRPREAKRPQHIYKEFKAAIEGRFAPLLIYDHDKNLEEMTASFEETMLEAAKEILGPKRVQKKPWITQDLLALCDEIRELKK